MRIIHVSNKKAHTAFSRIVYLQAKTHEVFFLVLAPCDNPDYMISSRYRENGILYIHINVRKNVNFRDDPDLEFICLKLFSELNPDVIHLQLFSELNARSILRAGAGISAKKAMTLHDHSLFCLRGYSFDNERVCSLNSFEECYCQSCRSAAQQEKVPLSGLSRIRKARCKEIVSLLNTIICCSYWQKNVLKRLLDNHEKIMVLYHGYDNPKKYKDMPGISKDIVTGLGIDWNDFVQKIVRHGWGKPVTGERILFLSKPDDESADPREVFGADFDKLVSAVTQPVKKVRKKSPLPSFGYLGTVWELKGLDILMSAIEQVAGFKFQVMMAVRTRLMGKDEQEECLAKLKSYPMIQLMPDVDWEDLYEKFFSQIDYLIIPSIWEETGPMTLFEAFYYKKPVIIYNRPSMVEKTMPGVNALVFDSADTLAVIMKDIIEGKASLGARTRKNFPVKTFKQYVSVLEKIYGGTSGHHRDKGSFTLNVGFLCNSNCIFCVRGMNEAVAKVDFDVLKGLLQKYRGRCDKLKITGGEPMARQDFLLILETARQLGYHHILIETNGTMLARANLAKKIMAFEPDIVAYLESHRPRLHDRINRNEGSFYATVSGIKKALKYKGRGRVSVKVMIVKYNYRDLLMMAKLITRLGVDKIIFVFIDPGGYAERSFNAIVPRYSQVRPYLEQALTWLMQQAKIKISLENFPFCCLDPMFCGFESQRFQQERTKAFSYAPEYGNAKAKMYAPIVERRKRKEKTGTCAQCRFDPVCEGVYQRYVRAYGWSEFHPVY